MAANPMSCEAKSATPSSANIIRNRCRRKVGKDGIEIERVGRDEEEPEGRIERVARKFREIWEGKSLGLEREAP